MVPLRGLEVIRRLQVDLKSASEYLERSGGGKFFYFVTRETVDPAARLHARMLFYNGEDPATGSAAGCAAAWMVANGVAQAGRARAHRARHRNAAAQPHFCTRFAPWITEWLTFAWEEMLWKFCAEKFFSEPQSSIVAKKCGHAQARIFFNGAN